MGEDYKHQLAVARNEINNLRQQLATLNHIHKKEINRIRSQLENWQCLQCTNKQENCTEESVNSSRTDANLRSNSNFPYIGTVRTHFPEKRGTPRQPVVCQSSVAKLIISNDVFTNPNHAVEGLQEFSHMWIIFHFHKNHSAHVRAKVAPPRLNGARTGVFASRSPNRPCPIGLSLVKIDRILDNTIYFSGVDMVDNTPVLDIKPYIPQYDSPHHLTDLSYTITESEVDIDVGDISSSASSMLDNSGTANLRELSVVRTLEGEENGRREEILGSSRLNESANEDTFYQGVRMGEREAPDGEEEDTAVASQLVRPQLSLGLGQNTVVRVPSWIDKSPVPKLNVLFKDRALGQLNELGSEGEQKKTVISSVLKEDPRSVYLRERWGSHCYVFRIANLFVSCKFNDATQNVTVYQVFQNETEPPDLEHVE